MTTTAIQVPAGWYPDPLGTRVGAPSTHRRWWSGDQWTEHVEPLQARETPYSPDISGESVRAARDFDAARRAGGTQVAAPAAFHPSLSAPTTVSPRESAEAARLMSLHAGSVGTAGPFATTATATDSRRQRTASSSAHRNARDAFRPRVYTASIWLMATMPLTQALLIVVVFSTLPATGSDWTRALTIALPFILYGALAGQDTRLMALAGHLRTAPWITALTMPPVYLGVRSARVRRTTGSFAWPLYVWILAQAAVVGAWWTVDPAGLTALIGAIL